MNVTFESTMYMLRALTRSGQIKTSRNRSDYIADQVLKASSRSSLLGVAEAFAEAVQSDIEYISSANTSQFMRVINSEDAPGVCQWLRKNYKMAGMILTMKKPKDGEPDPFEQALMEVDILPTGNMGTAMPGAIPTIPMTIQCLQPLSHGGDLKAGNSTLFRRMEVLSTTGFTLTLPYYGANAIRGILRDELADHFTTAIGLAPSRSNPPYSDWFFAALYSGGKLEENAPESKALAKEMGTNGTMKVKGIHRFRNMVPPLSVLGVSLGNRILCRHGFDNLDAIPRCREWGTGEISEAELLTWVFLTRQDNAETRPITDGDGSKSDQMIANIEALKRGAILDCGVGLMEGQTDIERACVGKALQLLQQRGKLGANNRMGLGAVAVDYPDGYPDPRPYDAYLQEYSRDILEYLHTIGALKYAPLQLTLASVDAA